MYQLLPNALELNFVKHHMDRGFWAKRWAHIMERWPSGSVGPDLFCSLKKAKSGLRWVGGDVPTSSKCFGTKFPEWVHELSVLSQKLIDDRLCVFIKVLGRFFEEVVLKLLEQVLIRNTIGRWAELSINIRFWLVPWLALVGWTRVQSLALSLLSGYELAAIRIGIILNSSEVAQVLRIFTFLFEERLELSSLEFVIPLLIVH